MTTAEIAKVSAVRIGGVGEHLPADERADAGADREDDERGGGAISQPLARCLGVLGPGDQVRDLGEHGVLTDAGRADGHGAAHVDGAAHHRNRPAAA